MKLIVAIFLVAAIVLVRYLRPARPKQSASLRTAGKVRAVCKSSDHAFSKELTKSIKLVEDLGVEGDCHLGKTVQHRSRLKIQPPPKNLRQVHLMHSELFTDLAQHTNKNGKPFLVRPGDLGENITTEGIDLLQLSEGTRLHFLDPALEGMDTRELQLDHPVVRITGLRNPCPQIQKFQDGLQELCIVRDADRKIIHRKAGIMSVVDRGGEVRPGDVIIAEEPAQFVALECV